MMTWQRCCAAKIVPAMTDQHEAFLNHFLQVQDGLRAAAHALCGDPHLADDVFQETAIACWRSYETYDSDRSFNAWARGILRNVLVNQWRRQGRQGKHLSGEAVEQILAIAPEPQVNDPRLEALRACMAQLAPRASALLALRYGEDLGREAIAQRLGSSAEAIKKALTRARNSLSECLAKRLGKNQVNP